MVNTLQIADELDKTLDFQNRAWAAASELRRLHEVNQELLEAATKTVEENRHLADGDNCTLIHLVRAIAKATGETK